MKQTPIADLSTREEQIARMYASGLSHKDIADQLCIAPSTVRTHISTIFRKLDISNKLALSRAIDAHDANELIVPDNAAALPARTFLRGPAFWSVLALAAFGLIVITTLTFLSRGPVVANPGPVPVAFDGPSIAVMPVDVSGGSEADRSMLAAINRDIVTDLAQFSDIMVIAAGTSFRPEFTGQPARSVGRALGVRYVLNGAADWRGEMLRVTLRLTETETAQVVWSESFDTTRDGLLRFQSEVSTRVIGVIGPVETGAGHLRDAEMARITQRPTDALSAYDLFVQGMVHFERFTEAENARARALFREAISIDPTYGKAFAMVAWSLVVDVWNERTPDPDAKMAEAKQMLDMGFEADPNEPYLHWALGAYHLFSNDHDRSIAAFRKAVELNPNGADLRIYLGWAMVYAGDPQGGLAEMEVAVRLNPRHPGWYHWDIGFAHVMAGDYEAAARTLEARQPKTPGTYELLAVSYALNGDEERAAAAVDQLLALQPDLTIASRSQIEPFARDEDRRKYFDAMRTAGIPES